MISWSIIKNDIEILSHIFGDGDDGVTVSCEYARSSVDKYMNLLILTIHMPLRDCFRIHLSLNITFSAEYLDCKKDWKDISEKAQCRVLDGTGWVDSMTYNRSIVDVLSERTKEELKSFIINQNIDSAFSFYSVHQSIDSIIDSTLETTKSPQTKDHISETDKSLKVSTKLLFVDHMNQPSGYLKRLEKWSQQLGLRCLVFITDTDLNSKKPSMTPPLNSRIKHIFVILQCLVSNEDNIEQFTVNLRTQIVDVHADGTPCKERKSQVLTSTYKIPFISCDTSSDQDRYFNTYVWSKDQLRSFLSSNYQAANMTQFIE